MTDFELRFGHTVTLKLETTFRFSQSLCDISSAFVQMNPLQIRKAVRSSKPDVKRPVVVIRSEDESRIRSAVAARLDAIAQGPGSGARQKVLLLGRYQKDREFLPLSFDQSRLDVDFITVHSSKGLEADHVILPRVTSDTLGFPSRVADDPVLQLAMPGCEALEFSEERRLFYVALTRARTSVTLITVSHKESTFVTELVRDYHVEVRNADGTATTEELCPVCGDGFLVRRKGKYGPFLGCSNFPKCRNTKQLAN
jgi:DNA helicase-4